MRLGWELAQDNGITKRDELLLASVALLASRGIGADRPLAVAGAVLEVRHMQDMRAVRTMMTGYLEAVAKAGRRGKRR